MSRTSRLFDLIQVLRSHRRAVTAISLAAQLGVSKRTVHRDLDALRALGAPIDGEAGIGYLLRPGFMLPPLMLTAEELEALALGALWVRQRGDGELISAAISALSKIASVVPDALTSVVDMPSHLTAATCERTSTLFDAAAVRQAIRERRKLSLVYAAGEDASERLVWPIALVYVDEILLLAAWCEMRQAFRHFRADRVRHLQVLPERYPGNRSKLTQAWHAQDRTDRVRRA